MSQEIVMNALWSLGGILVLWWLFVWLYSDFQVDRFRQEMFTLRNQLFDEGMEGVLGFDHPAYGILRTTMNGFIRFGHRLTLPQLALFAALSANVRHPDEESFSAKWEKATKELPADTRALLDSYQERMHVIVIKHLVWSSPITTVTLVLPIIAAVALRYCLSWLLRTFNHPISNLDTAALAYGG